MEVKLRLRWLTKQTLDRLLLRRNLKRLNRYCKELNEIRGQRSRSDIYSIIQQTRQFSRFPPAEIWNWLNSKIPMPARGAVWAMCSAMQDDAELTAFLRLVSEIKPRRAMEIGTADGGTLFCLSHFVSDHLISLDLPQGKFGGGYGLYRSIFYQHFERITPGLNLSLVQEDSHLNSTYSYIESLLDGKQLDLLFIDGDHTYAGVKADYLRYSPLVRPGGIIAFHDICTKWDLNCTVDVFWQELTTEYPDKCKVINKCNRLGIGVLQK